MSMYIYIYKMPKSGYDTPYKTEATKNEWF